MAGAIYTLVLRISFKRDATLASPPQLLDASLSPDAAMLMHSALSALSKVPAL
jgi:hypothetical protein